MVEPSVSFRIWVRRSGNSDAPFALRFEVFDGKGILRVARPGILIDPPARVSGFEDALTGEQIKASRFLHVWGGGRKRQSHILSRLEDHRLGTLAIDTWYELHVDNDAGYRYLLLEGPRPKSAAVAEEPVMRAEVRHVRFENKDEVTELTRIPPRRAEAPSEAPIPTVATVEDDGDDDGDDDLIQGEASATEITTIGGNGVSHGSPAHPFDTMPANTVLVRMLRRELSDAKVRNKVLEARLGVLEAQLKDRR